MLTITDKYMVEQSLTLYNQVLYTKFYSLLWKGKNILAAWDEVNQSLANIIIGHLEKDELLELEQILYDYENNEENT